MRPLPSRDVRTWIALWRAGYLWPWETPAVAELLLREHEGMNLSLLATEDWKSPVLSELFEKCLKDINEPTPAMEVEEMELLVLEHYRCELATGRADTWELLTEVYGFRAYPAKLRTEKAEDLRNLFRWLMSHYYALTSYSQSTPEEFEELRLEAVKACREWPHEWDK